MEAPPNPPNLPICPEEAADEALLAPLKDPDEPHPWGWFELDEAAEEAAVKLTPGPPPAEFAAAVDAPMLSSFLSQLMPFDEAAAADEALLASLKTFLDPKPLRLFELDAAAEEADEELKPMPKLPLAELDADADWELDVPLMLPSR